MLRVEAHQLPSKRTFMDGHDFVIGTSGCHCLEQMFNPITMCVPLKTEQAKSSMAEQVCVRARVSGIIQDVDEMKDAG